MKTATFKIWRGDAKGGEFRDYRTEISEGMVVLDAVNHIQATQANDLACRWNCKAGKCGSCSAEVNGMPKLMCMSRLSDLPLDKPVTIEPIKAFPITKDLITDVSWNFRVKKKIKKFKPRPPDAPDGTWDRLLQHHEVLHEGLSGGHSNHRQRNHPVEGTRRGRSLRSARVDLEKVEEEPLTMSDLKPLSREAIPAALEKAERYRLLN